MEGLRLGFIGAGNMATAILDGVIAKNVFPPESIIVSNPHTDKLEHPKALGVQVTCDNRSVVRFANLIILAVKPQKFEEVLADFVDCCTGKCFVSIAAGISAEWISDRLPGASVVRVMPNTPLQLGFGATAIAQTSDVPDEIFRVVCDIFAAAGSVAVIPEDQMDEVIPISGSSPAFFFHMADVMVRWAHEQGMNPEVSLALTAETMRGAAEMLLRSGRSAEELTRQVCSPGGTTLAALSAFEDRDFDELMFDAMSRCVSRAKELGK